MKADHQSPMPNLSFRARLFFSYFLLILLAAGIVYGVSAWQIRNAEAQDFEISLVEDADNVRNDLEDLLIEHSKIWTCDQFDEFTSDQKEQVEGIFAEEFEGREFDCDELDFGECWVIANALGLNSESNDEDSEPGHSEFCNRQLEYIDSDLVQQEIEAFLIKASEDRAHITLWDEDGETILFSIGEGVDIDAQILADAETNFEDELLPFENEETGEEYVYISRIIWPFETPLYILTYGASDADIISSTRRQALMIAWLTATAGMILLLFLGSWMANTLSKPLIKLRSSAQAMAAGQLDTRADTVAPPEIRELAEDFNTMAAAVEAMVAEQRAFANNAAHELRTPLTAMRIRTEALLEDEPDEQMQQTYIGEIHDEIKRLSRLVEDLRLLSRADAQNLAVGSEQVNLINLARALLREFNGQIKEKELEVELDSAEELFIVKASSSHIRVALRNVIENAIKYTPVGGRVTITMGEHIIDEQTYHQILVTDTGMGIPAEDLPKLTKRFYRVDKAHNREIPGSGLGLSLVASIVELYGGHLEISSEGLGKGSKAVILLPILHS